MSWYYVELGQQKGPVEEKELVKLVSAGVVGESALVWKEGLQDWKALSISAPEILEAAKLEMATIGDTAVTANEKDLVVQKMREGVDVAVDGVRYAGFWIRTVGWLIDKAVLIAVNMVVSLVFSLGGGILGGMAGSEFLIIGSQLIGGILNLVLQYGYYAWMVGKYQATLGKMALGLKVIKPSGGRVGYLLGFARGLAASLIPALIMTVVFAISAVVFFGLLGFNFEDNPFTDVGSGVQVGLWIVGVVGTLLAFGSMIYCYAMAGWDREKRALHDRVCSTRVVYK